MMRGFSRRWPDHCPIGGALVLEETSAMNRTRSLLARTGTMIVLILAAIAFLWFVIFPWASIHLPIDMTGVD